MIKNCLVMMSLCLSIATFAQQNTPNIQLFVNQKAWNLDTPIPIKEQPRISLKIQDAHATQFAIDILEIWSAEADTLPVAQEGSVKLTKKNATTGVFVPLPLDLKSGSIAEYRINKLYRKEKGQLIPLDDSRQVVKVRFQ